MKPQLRATFPLLGLLLASPVLLGAQPVPLIQAHAHNDYLHTRPLLDALDHGFCSVEADIHLVDGKLLVAHERQSVKPEKTLQALYLEPLRQQVRRNGGRVYPHGPGFTLLIDLKSDWQSIYPVLREALAGYADILNSFSSSGTGRTNAVTVVISGSRALKMFENETVRYAAYDGDLSNLDSTEPAALIPWISANWSATFKWRGVGEMPPEDKKRLKELVGKAHQSNRRVRFWGAPDQQPFWAEMVSNGVDLINSDDLEGLETFLQARAK